MLPLFNWPYAPNCYSIFIKIYDLLQLQFKTHSVLLRLGARRAGSLDSFGNCDRRRLVRYPHRIGLPPGDCPYQTLYIPATPSAGRNCGRLRRGGVNLASSTAGQQPREPVGATRNKPAVGPASPRARNRTAATGAR
jgi:hypothetical protein